MGDVKDLKTKKQTNIYVLCTLYLSICATTAGPYQSPACFPEVIPSCTSLWMPNWADGPSPNQDTMVRWYASCRNESASSAPTWAGQTGWVTCDLSPWMEASNVATSLRAALLVHVSVSRGSKVSASDQVQSGDRIKKNKINNNKKKNRITSQK